MMESDITVSATEERHVIENATSASCCEHISDDGGVDTAIEGFALVVAEIDSSASHANFGFGVTETENGERGENLLGGERWLRFESRPLDWDEDIDGDGDRADHIAQEDSHLGALLHGLTHADYATGANAEADLLSPTDGLELLVDGVRCAERREETWSALDVAMIVTETGVIELLKLMLLEEPHAGAEVDFCITGHLVIYFDSLVDFGIGHGAATGDKRETLDALGSVVDSHLDGLVGTDERVLINASLVLMALTAPLAILGASAATGVDD